jgi:hypothetical protein
LSEANGFYFNRGAGANSWGIRFEATRLGLVFNVGLNAILWHHYTRRRTFALSFEPVKWQMAWTLDDVLPAIVNAGDIGLTRARIAERLAKRHRHELSQALKALMAAEEVWGPVKFGRSEYYFASGRGPSAKTTGDIVARLASKAGTRLLSSSALEKKVTGMDALFLVEGIKHAAAAKAILQLACGNATYYLHRHVAEQHFSSAEPAPETPKPSPARPHTGRELTMEEVRPTLLRLTAEQGGLKIIKIYDLLKSLDVPKEDLHRFLIKEAEAGRVTIHPTTSAKLNPQVIEAGIKLPGYSEPFITVAIKD